jgi:hypothetical protein
MSSAIALFIMLAVSANEPVTIHPTRGQELIYRGQFTEETSGSAPTRRTYELESRTFILETGPSGAEVAFLTILRAAGAATDVIGSARLELGSVDAHGRVRLQTIGASPRVPLNGPPTLEAAGFVELPIGPIVGLWDAIDGSRPPREWRVAGDDFDGSRCLKLIGEQESADWRQPTGNGTAWHRIDIVWLATATGTVRRLERTIERRAGGDGSPAYSSHTEYELKNALTSPERLAADYRREILKTGEFDQRLAMLSGAGRDARPQLQNLLAQIDRHIEAQSATPYRPAITALRQRAEAGLRGEVPPPADSPEPVTPPPAVGRMAPDFITTDLVSGAPMRVARWRGEPVALFFVRPDSAAAGMTLEIAADLQKRYKDRLHIAVLVVSDEERVRPAWTEFGVPFFAGQEAAVLYALTGSSRAVILDSTGVVRHLGDAGPGVIAAVQTVVAPLRGQ